MRNIYKISLLYVALEIVIPVAAITLKTNRLERQEIIPAVEEVMSCKMNDEGPSQPEVQSFKPVGSNDLVDPFTGDFSYNIPLLDIGGYPINLFYQSGVTMEEEAGWVGLGWNLNPGVINRTVRGLPDDFDGDVITKEYNTTPNKTWGVSISPFAFEYYGKNIPFISQYHTGFGTNLSVNYNNYQGYGIEVSISPNISAGSKFSGSLSANLGIGSERGSFFEPSANVNYNTANSDNSKSRFGLKSSIGISSSFDSKEGWKSLHLNSSIKAAYNFIGIDFRNSAVLNFTNPTYTPSIQTPMSGFGFSGSFKFGTEAFGAHPNIDLKGYYSEQHVSENTTRLPAYGFMYYQHCNNGNGMMDINREGDGIYRQENPDLPITNLTYDIFNANGQGLSGSFRAFRGEIGTVSDNQLSSGSNPNANIGFEIGVGNAAHLGTDLAIALAECNSGKWMEGNQTGDVLRFSDGINESPDFEPVYFKNMGETNVMSNPEVYETFGAEDPCEIMLDSITHKISIPIVHDVKTDSKKSIQNPTAYFKQKREHRNSLFTTLNGDEARSFAIEKNIVSYKINYFGEPTYNSTGSGGKNIAERTDINIRKRNYELYGANHISEITITKDEGSRYIFGIPAYNVTKKEVSFNVSNSEDQDVSDLVDTNRQVNYQDGADNSTANKRGINHYFNAVTTPPYAYAYLLTAILSADYVDLTGDGPTSDDFGTYTKFNYTRVADRYKWREPYGNNKASFQEGNLADPLDDIGNYIFGEKEIYYIHSIETKNYIAEFTIAPRLDGIEVKAENGGMNAYSENNLYKLVKIELYAKAERMKLLENAVPIKTVHFEYDYSLCKGFPTNNKSFNNDASGSVNHGGKLTLKKIYFTYEKSKKGIYNPYVFKYGYNPNYNTKSMDRWGNYMPNNSNANELDNTHFPYTDQDIDNRKTKSDLYASAWLLDSIFLPSGSLLKVDYEADDYGYVQDKQAMQMFKIIGINEQDGSNDIENKNSFIFKLKTPLENNQAGLQILHEYIKGVNEMNFRCLMNIRNDNVSKEYIKGYIAIDPAKEAAQVISFYGSPVENKYRFAKINFDPISIDDDNENDEKVNPVSKATWQFIRLYLSRYSRDMNDEPSSEKAEEMFKTLGEKFKDLILHFSDFNSKMKSEGIGRYITLSKSFIRLNAPDKIKIGGGSRVRQITINDEWGKMQSTTDLNKNFIYGNEYIYKTTEDFYGNERTISSGVAAFEPIVGGEENPLVIPDKYRIKKIGVMDDELYRLEPYGQSFYPACIVGYSKIKIRSIHRDMVSSNGTGCTVSEFYTAKDYPVIVQKTDPQYYRDYLNFGEQLYLKLNPLFFINHDFVNTNQGYVIELNNMHGKLKRQSVYAEKDSVNPVSFVEYRYKNDQSFKIKDTYKSRLDNHALVMESNGKLSKTLVGVDYEFVADARYEANRTSTPEARLNCDLSFYGPIGVPVFTGWPYFDEENTKFESQVLTKLIYRTGLIDTVIAYDLGSKVTTTNLVYDAVTGLPLITKSGNEFNDAYYTYNIPAHHVYERMGPAYQNIGMQFSDLLEVDANSRLKINGADKYFVKGDELLVERQGSNSILGFQHAWVDTVIGRNYISVIKEDGSTLDAGRLNRIKIIRSGRRNMQNNSVGQIIMKHNPVPENIDGSSKLELQEIIDSKTTEYSDHWQTYAAFKVEIPQSTCNCNEGNYPNQLLSKLKLLLPIINKLEVNKDYAVRKDGSICTIKYTQVINKVATECSIVLEIKNTSEFPNNVTAFSDLHYIRNDFYTCPEFLYDFKATISYQGANQEILTATVYGKSTCIPVANCSESISPSVYNCNQVAGTKVNPFRLGLAGIFRPLRSLMYLTERTSEEAINKSGVYNDFAPYWNINSSPDWDTTKWTWTNMNIITDPFGKVLETEDALGRFSADVYGYAHNFVTASAKNARYRQIAYDGFEDYDFENRVLNTGECDTAPHFKFYGARLSETESHSGKHSINVNPGSEISVTRGIYKRDNTVVEQGLNYKIKPGDLIGIFNPDTGEYFLSVWVKCPLQSNQFQYSNVSVKVSAGSSTFDFSTSGKIIDGWQQINGVFSIPPSAINDVLKISLVNSTGANVYFDDIRVQPFNSSMQTYAYDSHNLRLMAVMDENNFATFYEYDEEGQLTRTKKETEEGVMTIQEIRAGKPKLLEH